MASRVRLGAVAIVTVAAVIGAMLLVKAAGLGYHRFSAQFAQAAALHTGDVVAVAGIPVGAVTDIALAGDHVLAKIRVRDDVPVGRESRAAIKVSSLFGSRYVELRPAGGGDLPDRTIDRAHTEVPYDLQAALADSTRTFEQVDAEQIATSLRVLNAQVDGLPAIVPQAMANVQALSAVIAQRREQLGSLLVNTEHVANVLRRQQSTVGAFIRQTQGLVGEFVARSAMFHQLMASVRGLVETLRAVAVDDRAALDEVLGTLGKLGEKFAAQDALFRNLLQIAPVPIREIANATGFGNAIEVNAPAGILIDSWMCAISGRAQQFGFIPYFKDCQR